jgi:DNA methylase
LLTCAKNLLGLPWRVALALQDDGWTLRNAIVWDKPNAMPESVRDRLNCRYELIFLLVKSRYHWFDLDSIRVPHATTHPASGRLPADGSTTRRSPRAPAAGRHPGDSVRGGNRPSSPHPRGTRPPKYGPHARQVIAAQRYGTRTVRPGRSSRSSSTSTSPARSAAATRRPARTAAPVLAKARPG